MKLDLATALIDAVARAEEVVGAERENADFVVLAEAVAPLPLVVPVLELRVSEHRKDRTRVGVATADARAARRAAFDFRAVTRTEGRLDERTGVDGAHGGLAAPATLQWAHLGGDDGAGIAPELDGCGSHVKLDAFDEPGMDHGRAEEGVVDERHVHAVDEEADVAGRRAAHEKRRQAAHDRNDARLRFDRAQRIAERTRDRAGFGARDAHDARRPALSAHHDFRRLGGRLSPNGRGAGNRCLVRLGEPLPTAARTRRASEIAPGRLCRHAGPA